MKTPRATFAAAAIPLLLTSLPLTAAELPFNAPNTPRAQEGAQLLHQAAQALAELPATSALTGREQHITNLWIFPTAEADTVFAQYELASNSGAASTEHLTVLKVRGTRVLEQTELADKRISVASNDVGARAQPHWSASIGTGHAASAEPNATVHGVPGTLHWTATIGTGTAASGAPAAGTKEASPAGKQSALADIHWTSRIGTGHAADSNARERT